MQLHIKDIDILLCDKYINKMIKKINCQAIKPTKKPFATSRIHKSDHFEHIRLPQPPNSSRNNNLLFTDHIRQPIIEALPTSFKAGLIHTRQHQLASSFTFSDEDFDYEYQKLLFAKFLQTKELNWMSFMHDMNKISQQNLLSFVKIGGTQKTVISNRIIAHYIGVWLQQMGYKDIQTKKNLIKTVQYIFPKEQQTVGEVAQILYDRLFQDYLPQSLQLRLLIEVCKRGWEYLALFVGKYIKILKKYKHLKQQSFIQEVYKAI